MNTAKSLLLAACAICLSNVAFAQTTPTTTGTTTGTTTENGTLTVPRPLNQSGTGVNDPASISVDGTMGNADNTTNATKSRKTHKQKGSMSDGKGKMKTKM
ncbi:hypothetical protein GO988_12220 [Hymenobacter sp. HMF4947]|uniref:Uncharacterized protein n=1 Tax=Hymenobacter ginkgonis TaxID=2682976 RepID=A0A7K1TFA4_9BACT|nr:hypothetical protein [Hymenobacter ginkgonis]MVN77093.1 hypothetical protein [Hymenobacter ginkgonis]